MKNGFIIRIQNERKIVASFRTGSSIMSRTEQIELFSVFGIIQNELEIAGIWINYYCTTLQWFFF